MEALLPSFPSDKQIYSKSLDLLPIHKLYADDIHLERLIIAITALPLLFLPTPKFDENNIPWSKIHLTVQRDESLLFG